MGLCVCVCVCVQWFEHYKGVGYASRHIASAVELRRGTAVRVGVYKRFRGNLKFSYMASKYGLQYRWKCVISYFKKKIQ